MSTRLLLLMTALAGLFVVGCNDDERDAPHARHPHATNAPSEPAVQPLNPQKTEQQNKVSGAPPHTTTPATPAETAESAPGKPVEQNKVTGSPTDGAAPATPVDQRPPGKPEGDGKDATR